MLVGSRVLSHKQGAPPCKLPLRPPVRRQSEQELLGHPLATMTVGKYYQPMTGFETRMSGMEVLRNKVFHEKNDLYSPRSPPLPRHTPRG